MGIKVCIAEKPSVAREIARIVGATSKKNGYFEGNGYQVTWTFGHLCTLKEPKDYDPRHKRWDIFTLPILPKKHGVKLIGNDGVERQFNIIKKLVAGCDEVINCGDAGQEGELIQRWVLKHAENVAPVKRLWISSLTDEAIKEGFEKLRDGKEFDRLYAAGGSRAIGDWLLGINATRVYTLKYSNGKGVLSIGRVQTPTLAMIVNRHKEIEQFVPTPFWEIKTTYRETVFNATKGRYLDKDAALVDMEALKEHDFTVTSFTKKNGKEAPPRLFDLTALQIECNRKFSASADDTLKNVQSLYERKLVTYPRTDSQYLSNDLYPKIKGILQKLTPYEEFTTPLLQQKIKKSKKVFDDKKVSDHHAIIPTGIFPSGLNPMEKKVYDTITRRFLAAFHPDCTVANTTVLGVVGELEFKATGKQILEPGWRILYGTEATDSDDKIMPIFEARESGPHEPDLQEKKTQAPKAYTEATLLRAMETAGKQVDDDELSELLKENGIGRPSTRANIIETLFRRRYIRRERKNLVANPTGIQLIDTIENEMLKSVELTGQWERKLRLIEKGEYEVRTFMHEMQTMVSDMVEDVLKRPAKKISILTDEEMANQKKEAAKRMAMVTGKECPKCKQGKLLQGKSAYGCSRWKEDCKFTIPFVVAGKKLSDKQLNDLQSKGKTGKIKGLTTDAGTVDGYLKLTPEFTLEVVADKEAALHCPKCKEGELLKGKAAFGCARWKVGCDFKVPFELAGKKLTDKQLQQLLEKGKTSKIKGFVKGDGSKFDAKLVLTDSFNITFDS